MEIKDIDIRFKVGDYQCRATVQDNGPNVAKSVFTQVWHKGKWRRPFFIGLLHSNPTVAREITSKAYELVAAAVAGIKGGKEPVKA